MTSPPRPVHVSCPNCFNIYTDYIRDSVNLDLDPDMDLNEAFGVRCDSCGFQLFPEWIDYGDGEGGSLTAIPIIALDQTWRNVRERSDTGQSHEAVKIRLHRAFSWAIRAIDFDDGADSDGFFLYHWIAFNALYAKWKPRSEGTIEEWSIRRDFLEDMAERDAEGHIQQYLKANRATCDRLLSEEHLHTFYWADPTPESARKARSKSREAGKSYHAKDTIEGVLLPLIDRIAMLRGQLVHGQATFDSKVNRDLVETAGELVRGILIQLLTIIIGDRFNIGEAAWEESSLWEPLPFPPSDSHFRR